MTCNITMTTAVAIKVSAKRRSPWVPTFATIKYPAER